MTTAEIKGILQKWITETDDLNILTKVQAYFSMLKTKDADWWDTIDEYQKKEIETGLRQLNEGKGIPYEQVKEKAQRLIKKGK